MVSWLAAFAAGMLTTLSPCVLPVLPFVMGSARSSSRSGPAYLVFGLFCSFVISTLLVSRLGHVAGLSPAAVRSLSGIGLMLSSFLFLSDRLSDALASRLEQALAPLQARGGSGSATGVGHFGMGLFLGLVWTPCSGPSLGAALSMAASQERISEAAGVLSVFGMGAVLPLLLLALGAHGLFHRLRAHGARLKFLRRLFGVWMFAWSLFVLLGQDKQLEGKLVELLPNAWIDMTTRF